MEISLYEDWMKPQVAELFSKQYGIEHQVFSKLMDNFYDHPFQKSKSIRIIAREGDTIIGFQSFFYWPYVCESRTYNSFQSGNSLVHPDHRGKGIFQKLLNFLDQKKEELNIDFLVGFPVEESKNSFIRNNWLNITDLTWYINICNPFAFLFSDERLNNQFSRDVLPPQSIESSNTMRLSSDPDFSNWRNHYSSDTTYYSFTYREREKTVNFQLKFNKRSSYFNELIIGNIISATHDLAFIKKGLKKLKREAFKSRCITALSLAFNAESQDGMKETIRSLNFIKTNKKIYFIVKPFITESALVKKENWTLYRSDIDTW